MVGSADRSVVAADAEAVGVSQPDHMDEMAEKASGNAAGASAAGALEELGTRAGGAGFGVMLSGMAVGLGLAGLGGADGCELAVDGGTGVGSEAEFGGELSAVGAPVDIMEVVVGNVDSIDTGRF